MSADPSPNATPPPVGGGGGPSPQQIGNAFIKQYYKVLLTAPSQINRFYQPDSTVSRAMEPSAPAAPSPFGQAANGGSDEATPGERVRKAFFEWAGVGAGDDFAHTEDILRIDFERGAIDAQESIGGGILLVVTGHMFLPGGATPSPFVHTFFLNNAAGPGRKKQFLVKNDILRFLEPTAANNEAAEEEPALEEVVQVEEKDADVAPESTPLPAAVDEPVIVEPPAPILVQDPILVSPPVVEPISLVPVEYEASADEEKVEDEEEAEEPVVVVQHEIVDVEPAAEEEKIDATETSSAGSDGSPAAESSPSSDGKKKRNKKKRGSKSRSRSNSPKKEEKEETPEKPKTPGSWASLVASGGSAPKEVGKSKGRKNPPKVTQGAGTSDKPSNNQDSVKSPPQSKEPSAPATTTPTAPASTTSQSQSTHQQRKPQCTLFIRNIPDKTTNEEVRNMFEHHGVATGNKLTGITLNTTRGFCFVDFDGPAAVDAITTEAVTSLIKDPRTGRKIESSFMVHGRVLEVERKVPPNKGGGGGNQGGGGARRFNRSHSPKDGGGRYRGSRGSGGGSGGMRRSPPRGGGGGGGNR